MVKKKTRAPRNRTVTVEDSERQSLLSQIVKVEKLNDASQIYSRVTNGKFEDALPFITDKSIDLLILDPPYNLNKTFNSLKFSKTSVGGYAEYLDDLLSKFVPKLKDTASVYICGDWLSSVSIFQAASKYFRVQNRITWEREKGRGAKTNWKNCSEDIWFCTVSNSYTFNVEDVRVRRTVIAPYKVDGEPKDWVDSSAGKFRDTAPSNLMSDITIPFWSMPENTDHPTQKSEKLIAKLVLASSNKGDLVCDPFLGSGTTAVVCDKLNRSYIAIEVDEGYCLYAQKRLETASKDKSIQGYTDGVFWERNSLSLQKGKKVKETSDAPENFGESHSLFDI